MSPNLTGCEKSQPSPPNSKVFGDTKRKEEKKKKKKKKKKSHMKQAPIKYVIER
jgi:hypothetical protein